MLNAPVNCRFWSPKGLGGNCAKGIRSCPSRAFCEERCTQREAADPAAPPPEKPKVRPRPWPRLATFIARRRKPGEVGVGDTLARLIDGVGGALYKRVMAKLHIECGCVARQQALNRQYPYPPPTSQP